MLDFKDKVVLITGATLGFGRVLANAFAERGAKLAYATLTMKAARRRWRR
ncbi:MAG TPA: hypothetical protein VMW05_00980 [Methyloceanibacter sp.]|nr:hypothetical protein [Methyloceanibacter sp.]